MIDQTMLISILTEKQKRELGKMMFDKLAAGIAELDFSKILGAKIKDLIDTVIDDDLDVGEISESISELIAEHLSGLKLVPKSKS